MPTSASPADRLLVALDVPSLDEADSLLGRLDGTLTGCKIGSQLFTAAGPAAIETARKRGFRVFLDLKFHDIPNTVGLAVREATRLGVFMLNIHASGGLAMACAAAEAATKAAGDFGMPRPLCLGVTVLTSLDRRALQREVGVPTSVESHVLHLAAGDQPLAPGDGPAVGDRDAGHPVRGGEAGGRPSTRRRSGPHRDAATGARRRRRLPGRGATGQRRERSGCRRGGDRGRARRPVTD